VHTVVTGNMYRKFGEIWTCGSDMFERDERTDRHTDPLLTILRPPTGGRSKYSMH